MGQPETVGKLKKYLPPNKGVVNIYFEAVVETVDGVTLMLVVELATKGLRRASRV
jgi:hypothetical protein